MGRGQRIAGGLALLGLLAGAAAPALAQPPAKTPAELRGERFDRNLNAVRVAIAGAAIAVWIGRRRAATGPDDPAARRRRLALGALALLAAGANYNYFLSTRLHRHELFHYYLGSKYFPELGYFRLYECSVEAIAARGGATVPNEITDLRTKRRRPALELMADARRCAPDFTPARWTSFQDDVARFARLMGPEGFQGVLRDHGFNPSPVWTLVGRPLAETVPPSRAGLWLLARLDILVLLAGFGALVWGFGVEVACLAAIVWGTCGHTRYQWTGDAFLRQMWLAASMAALALAARARHAGAGACVALAAALRVFPVLFASGFVLREAWRALAARRLRPEAVRFTAGGLAAGTLLFAASLGVSARGLEGWREFAENMRVQTSFTPLNALGLGYLLAYTPPRELAPASAAREADVQAEKDRASAARRPLGIVVLVAFAALFVAALRPEPPGSPPRLCDAEALALGALAIPFATLPGSYYLGYVAAGAVLGARRPALGVAVLVACMAWSATLIAWPHGAQGYGVSSAVLLVWAFVVLVAVQRPPAALSAPGGAVILPARPGA